MQGKKKGRNFLFLRRFKRLNKYINKSKLLETTIFNHKERIGKNILQQVNIRRGDKTKSFKLVNNILLFIKKRYKNQNANSILNSILYKCRILIYFRYKKLGKNKQEIPVDLYTRKGVRALSRWLCLTGTTRSNPKKSSSENIFVELVSMRKIKNSKILKKRKDMNKLGLSSIPYLKYLKRQKMK